MRSQLKSSPTPKERLRAEGVKAAVEVTNLGMERLNDLISKMADLCDGLIDGMDRTPSSETVNSVYKIGQTIAGLTRARTDLEKLRLETQGLHQKALASVQAHLRNELQGHPELVNGLLEVMDTVNDKIQSSKK
ncbi:MAG: hypothetical protein ACP5VS_13960 [Desulfomonilaceae bacterium]